jgi:hypothetical protein
MNAPCSARLDPESQRLEDRLLEFIHDAPAGFVRLASSRAACYDVESQRFAELQAQFVGLALELFAYQYERVPVYRLWAQAQGRTPDNTQRVADIPALPVEAWRETRVATFPEQRNCAVFETSGTTSARPGVLHLDSLALYDASLERGFTHHVMPDRDRMRMLLLVPRQREAPRSSLGYMLHRARARFGTRASTTCVQDGRLDWAAARGCLEECAALAEPLCILGTAFAFVQLLDACDEQGWSIRLAEGSRLLETGGYKGRTRELSRAALYDALERRLGIPATHMVSEYGMTELGSQYYTLSLRQTLLVQAAASVPRAPDDGWSAPLWLRARIVNSETGRCESTRHAVAPGLLAHHDLANRGSVAHLICADVGQPSDVSFTLRGRTPRSELRGCGLLAESSLGAEAAGKDMP